ncbi:hypothetical protein F5890DRAFT_990421 [Lentinula detonsa]|uniref:Secreted protein n=1 Tax=Lentinula detonsa TaxID=2804962 RepID=A0AA38UUU8_9AGAR|nr:hypothetical protein F5890DRAFT_990421 [Lentinula detonsa]
MRPLLSLLLLVIFPNPPQLIPILCTFSNCIVFCLSSLLLSICNAMCRISLCHLDTFRGGFQDLNHRELLSSVTAAVKSH